MRKTLRWRKLANNGRKVPVCLRTRPGAAGSLLRKPKPTQNMKQTTIIIELEEDILGCNFIPQLPRKFVAPNEQHIALWQQIAATRSNPAPNWSAVHVADNGKEGFWVDIQERIVRICKSRPNHPVKIREVRTPSNRLLRVHVTVYWDRKKQQTTNDPMGVWTLREMKGHRTVRILNDCIPATLGCLGEELYCHLPDGDIPEGYDIFPDIGDIAICQTTADSDIWWRFNFKKSR